MPIKNQAPQLYRGILAWGILNTDAISPTKYIRGNNPQQKPLGFLGLPTRKYQISFRSP